MKRHRSVHSKEREETELMVMTFFLTVRNIEQKKKIKLVGIHAKTLWSIYTIFSMNDSSNETDRYFRSINFHKILVQNFLKKTYDKVDYFLKKIKKKIIIA